MGNKKTFNDRPFAYHEEIELQITTLTNLGAGLGRIPLGNPPPGETTAGWVVMVPFALPGERVVARVFRNQKNFSEADLVEIIHASPDRVAPGCPLFGRCGGCQYQNLDYGAQLAWKRRQVAELLQHLAGIEFAVAPVIPSPRQYGYRSKITPHFAAPKLFRRGLPVAAHSGLDNDVVDEPVPAKPAEIPLPAAAEAEVFPIGFLRQGTRFDLVDVRQCPIATDGINARLAEVRAAVHAHRTSYSRGATLLLREASGVVTTDYDAVVTETVGDLKLSFLARDFFQNNPFILPAFTNYVRAQAAASGAKFLVDAYCGSGLFALASAPAFERVAGVEISESSVTFARENAAANGITNATFLAADAAAIFAGLDFPAMETTVVIDPPRKGCDRGFLAQLFAFGPRAVVYVSCDPASQMRDLREFLTAGYHLTAAQPFDLFPQTRHLECVLTLRRGERR